MPIDFGDLVALAAALGWAATTVMARHISKAIPAAWYNALRTGVASAAMLVALPWTLQRADLSNVTALGLALLLISVLTGFALGDTAFFESMRRIGVARAAPVAGTHPLVTALLAVAFLGEPVTLALTLGVVVIGVGVWLITTDKGIPAVPARGPRNALVVGVVLALIAAVGWAASTVLVRPALREVDVLVASTIRMPFATLVLLLAATRLGRVDSRQLVLKPATVAWLIFAGLLTVASGTLFLWSVDLAGAARTAALSSVSPIFSATIAVMLLGEQITVRLALGMGISLAGVLAIVVAGRQWRLI
jgi:drug/metabolite transporter (DMT)-like permease